MKHWTPTAIVALASVLLLIHGPIAQLPDYNNFADQRALWGIPNAADVLSNVPFIVIGSWGLWAATGHRLFFAGIVLTALGSTYYHLAPDNDRLFWDRLPIALTCAGLLTAYRRDTQGPRPKWLMPALVLAAIATTAWWHATGDLRPYIVMQAAPLLVIPLWQWTYGAPREDRIAFAVAIVLYSLAKIFEFSDRAVFEALGFVSGHTIKHLLAAMAAAILTANLVSRAGTESYRPGQGAKAAG